MKEKPSNDFTVDFIINLDKPEVTFGEQNEAVENEFGREGKLRNLNAGE